MKGVILRIIPQARFVDLSHDVPAQDLHTANYYLMCSYRFFPKNTVFLCVIDPSVGSERRPIIVTTDRYYFVAPDNGVLSCILEKENSFHVFEIRERHFFLDPVSQTFHGRDIFAPVAARLSRGIEPHKFGPEIHNPVRLDLPRVQRLSEHKFVGAILHIDRFGNLVSNFPYAEIERVAEKVNLAFHFRIGDQEITQYQTRYCNGNEGRIFAISGSSGYIEFSVYKGSAAKTCGALRGDVIHLEFC